MPIFVTSCVDDLLGLQSASDSVADATPKQFSDFEFETEDFDFTGYGTDDTGGETEPEQVDPTLAFDFDCVDVDPIGEMSFVPPEGIRTAFRVRDCEGNPVPALDGSELTITNKTTGDVVSAVSAVHNPIDYDVYSILAVDVSDDVIEGGALGPIVDGALSYIRYAHSETSLRADHHIAVMAFGGADTVELIADFTTDTSELESTLEGLRGRIDGGEGDFYHAYTQALAQVEAKGLEGAFREHFLVMVGAEQGAPNEEWRQAALEAQSDTDVSVHTIGWGSTNTGYFRELASTRANYVLASATEQIETAFDRTSLRVEATARSNYVVGVCHDDLEKGTVLELRVELAGSKGDPINDSEQVLVAKSMQATIGGSCDEDAIATATLACNGESQCVLACDAMACGCDRDIRCGECGEGTVCSGSFECVPGEGTGDGEQSCFSSELSFGIQVDTVEANQAVGTVIATSSGPLDVEDYSSKLVSRRELVIRAGWVLDEGWSNRDIRGDLTLEYANGERMVYSETVYISATSSFGNLDDSFVWSIPGSEVEPGMRYSVGFYEVAGSIAVRSDDDSVPLMPNSGTAELGVPDTKMAMKVWLVPVTHKFDGCVATGDVYSAKSGFESLLYRTYPLNSVDISVADGVEYEGDLDMDGWVNLLAAVSAGRAEEGEISNDTYYFGVLEPCTDARGVTGIGYRPTDPGTEAAGPYRTAVGMEADWTFVHELGHNHGRRHVKCTGAEGNPDTDYPHEDGAIGVYGIDIQDTSLKSTAHTDYMSYCETDWVSDYGWNLAYDVIAEISLWSTARKKMPREQAMIMGTIRPNGAQNWWTQNGSVSARAKSAHGTVQYFAGDVMLSEVIADVNYLSDDETIVLSAPLSGSLDELTHLEWAASQDDQFARGVQRVEVDELRFIHNRDTGR